MDLESTLHMNPGSGESSYASNSLLQETIIRKALPVIKHTIKGMANHDIVFGQNFKIADLGCSSGKNALLVASKVIDIVKELCEENFSKSPQFEVCLNDLFVNDFNTLFRMIPNFYSKHKEKGKPLGPCFVSATPGSFYVRLFLDKSLHFIHSSNAVHWLSQVPQGVENNTSNIYMAKSSPPNVFDAYRKQFDTDFTKYLQMRSEELVRGGCMVLTLTGRSISDPTSDECILWGLLSRSLLDMLNKGLIEESKLNSFNLPFYSPCEDEVRNIIGKEGSFSLDTLNFFQLNWDPLDTDYTNTTDSKDDSYIHAKSIANTLRAAMEPMLTSHFGNFILDPLFNMFEKNVANHLAIKKTRYFLMIISLSQK